MTSIPKRPLGKTGYQVSILALGGVTYNLHSDAEAAAVVHRGLELGINYIDTAYSYKDSERKIAAVTAERRGEVFLATKTIKRDRAGAAAEIEESLRRLRTDHIDCLQLHDIHSEEDLAKVTGPDGALKAVEEFHRAGAIRFVGVTSHVSPEMLARSLREYPFDLVLSAMGGVHEAVRPFHGTVVPAARERGAAVLAMKVFGSGFLNEQAETALRFALGLEGVAAAVVGVDNVEQLERNAAVAADFHPLSADERARFLATSGEIYRRRQGEAWFLTKKGV